jgi:hypothetical protein
MVHSLKNINVSYAKRKYNYMNTKPNYSYIYLNEICLEQDLTRKHAQKKINNNKCIKRYKLFSKYFYRSFYNKHDIL